jgi:hypothetical protein
MANLNLHKHPKINVLKFLFQEEEHKKHRFCNKKCVAYPQVDFLFINQLKYERKTFQEVANIADQWVFR